MRAKCPDCGTNAPTKAVPKFGDVFAHHTRPKDLSRCDAVGRAVPHAAPSPAASTSPAPKKAPAKKSPAKKAPAKTG